MQRRRELHRRVAAAIETLFADRLEEFFSLLAYHYSKAEDWEKAQEYLFKAGDQAGSIAADAEALAHYQEAIEAYTRAFGDTWDPLERAALERKMGEALYRRGEQARASEYLLPGARDAGQSFPRLARRGAPGDRRADSATDRASALPLVPAASADAGCGPRRRGALPRVLHARVEQHVRRHAASWLLGCPALPERGRERGARVGGIRGSLLDGDDLPHGAVPTALSRLHPPRADAGGRRGLGLASWLRSPSSPACTPSGSTVTSTWPSTSVQRAATCIAGWARHVSGPRPWGWPSTCRPRRASWLRLSRRPGDHPARRGDR